MTRSATGRHDFDFLHGRWTVRHRRLAARGCASDDWRAFNGTAETRPLLGGLLNIEEHRVPGSDDLGVAMRTFSAATHQWSIHWVSGKSGALEPPVVGGFDGPIGHFEGVDVDEGRLVQVRFRWDRTRLDSPRWEQRFSYDDGASWELNWTMDFER